MAPRATFLLALILLVAVPVHAGWSPEGATIKSTSSVIPQVAACSDEAQGAFVAWQEGAAVGDAILRVQRVLATGDVHPSWPAAGVIACSLATWRPKIGTLADGLGGAYLWWLEDVSQSPNHNLFLTHVGSDGQIMPDWPARGRLLGMMALPRPSPVSSACRMGAAASTWRATSRLAPTANTSLRRFSG